MSLILKAFAPDSIFGRDRWLALWAALVNFGWQRVLWDPQFITKETDLVLLHLRRQSRECCQQVPKNHGGLLLSRCALPGRGVQQELPSTITNGRNLVLMSPKKCPACREIFFLFCGFCEEEQAEKKHS